MTLPLFDDLAVGDVIITEELPSQTTGYRRLDHSDPPMTTKAIAAREMAEWKAQEPDDSAMCPHGQLLTIETCEEGCQP